MSTALYAIVRGANENAPRTAMHSGMVTLPQRKNLTSICGIVEVSIVGAWTFFSYQGAPDIKCCGKKLLMANAALAAPSVMPPHVARLRSFTFKPSVVK